MGGKLSTGMDIGCSRRFPTVKRREEWGRAPSTGEPSSPSRPPLQKTRTISLSCVPAQGLLNSGTFAFLRNSRSYPDYIGEKEVQLAVTDSDSGESIVAPSYMQTLVEAHRAMSQQEHKKTFRILRLLANETASRENATSREQSALKSYFNEPLQHRESCCYCGA